MGRTKGSVKNKPKRKTRCVTVRKSTSKRSKKAGGKLTNNLKRPKKQKAAKVKSTGGGGGSGAKGKRQITTRAIRVKRVQNTGYKMLSEEDGWVLKVTAQGQYSLVGNPDWFDRRKKEKWTFDLPNAGCKMPNIFIEGPGSGTCDWGNLRGRAYGGGQCIVVGGKRIFFDKTSEWKTVCEMLRPYVKDRAEVQKQNKIKELQAQINSLRYCR